MKRKLLKLKAPPRRAAPAQHRRRPHQAAIKIGTDYYVLTASLATHRDPRVLADARSFAVFESAGDILLSDLEALGLFFSDTRYLSRFHMTVAGNRLVFLNSYLSDDNVQVRINLTNPDIVDRGGAVSLPRNSIHIERSWVLIDGALFHRLTVRNYSRSVVTMPLDLFLGADFADLFEVRGLKRKRRGALGHPALGKDRVTFHYRGLDGVRRFTGISFDPAPQRLTAEQASFVLHLEPDAGATLDARITYGIEANGAANVEPRKFENALHRREEEFAAACGSWARLTAGNELFDLLLRRSMADLTSIISRGSQGGFMMAGIPWFATLFGRDSLITALSVLPFNPELAGMTLRTLAALQGSRLDETRDEQPGKIVHEVRGGEMAATGEIPFGRYYGSVDATPLFLWLLGSYVAVTGDMTLAEDLWAHVERALQWIERYGDCDGDGYIEYSRLTPRGLSNQGWKDSFDSISHSDGTLARPPIALAEVQGYLYAAYGSIAQVARRLRQGAVADRLTERAAALKRAFMRDFWLEDRGFVALALDHQKKPCGVISSNPGHCLATGLLDGEHGAAVAARLLTEEMFTGWGMRTLSAKECRYNPMSYHNGSVWPHDNALAALGLAQVGRRDGVEQILKGLFDTAVRLRRGSLPELICGFPREAQLGPVPYPVACYPQAWSAASIFLILQAMLGLRVAGSDRRVTFSAPALPAWLGSLKIDKLRIGDKSASLMMRPTAHAATVEIIEKDEAVHLEIGE